MRVIIKQLFIIFVMMCLIPRLGSAATDLKAPAKLMHPEEIMQAFEQGQPVVKVAVNLILPGTGNASPRWGWPDFMKQWRQEINIRQNQVLDSLPQSEYVLRHRYENLSAFSAEITLSALERLADHPLVESIEPVYTLEPHLAQGIDLMNAAAVRTTYSGQGIAVAICDSGIDYTHPALGGGGFPNSKVIGGYDVGDNDFDPIPNSQAHGTCCAGIAAGDAVFVGDYIGGVANDAKLYALKITSGTSGSASSDDMAAAWDWCVTHQNDDPNNPILVISTSFGGSRYFGTCDSASSVITSAANNAVAAGITVLVSSGNDGYCDSISWPACVSSIISVGAVYDGSFGTYGFCVDDASCAPENGGFSCSVGEFPTSQATGADVVTVYSNTASILDLLAPSHNAYTTDIVGSGGYSSGDYDPEFGGTSASCPYAAGAVACIQSAAKSILGDYLSPEDIRLMLTTTGDPVTDNKVVITKPRINLGTAIGTLAGQPPTALDDDVTLPMDTTVSVTLEAIDDGLPDPPGMLTYTITSLPAHGMLTEPNGFLIDSVPYSLPNYQNEVLYTPRPGCAAPASFTFVADDGGDDPDGGTSNEAVISLQITVFGTIYTADMETDPGWTLMGFEWAWGTPTGAGGPSGNPDPTSGFTGSNVIGYDLTGNYGRSNYTEWATTPGIDCSEYSDITLTFYRWLNVDSPTVNPPPGDNASIQVSNDGSSWNTIWQNTGSVTDSDWTEQTFDISTVADNESTVYIRWGMGPNNSNTHYSGWNIDDVQLTGFGPAAFTPLTGDFEPDCDVDVDDLLILTNYWLMFCGECQGTDLVADSIVNFEDFAVFAEHWLDQL